MKKFIMLIAAFAMVLGFTATAMADATLYGSARFVTFWLDSDKEYISPTTTDDDEDLEWQMGKLSRFGVNFKEGDITGKFEVDARAGQLGSMNIEDGSGSSYHGNIRLRHLWGAWNFGSGELCIGHRHSLSTLYVTSFGNHAGAGMANYSGSNLRYFRVSQIRLTFGNLKIAFMTPDTDYKPYDVDNSIALNRNVETGLLDTDTTLPRIEIGYKLKLDPLTFDFVAGYQTFEVESNAAGNDEDDVDSYLAMVKAAANFGPMYVKGLVRYAQNGGNYGIWTAVNERAYWHDGDVQDSTAWGYAAAVGFKVSDMITLEAAYSGTTAENDDIDGSPEDDVQAYGILCKITPAPGVTIQPEIMMVDKMDSDYQEAFTGSDDQGEQLRIGVFWKIDFK